MPGDLSTPVNWLDQPLLLVRRSGRRQESPFAALLDEPEDPVVGADCGHPVLQLGFELLASHILQIVLAPEDDRVWQQRLLAPPTRAELEEALAPFRHAFVLHGSETPFLQVAPRREWTPDPQPVCGLLPDTPTGNAIDKDEDFFVKRGNYGALHAALAAPLLYAAQMLFPSGGGGYHDIPHRAGSLKYQVTGRTLWETLWLNVLSTSGRDMRAGAWPAPKDDSVFPWMMDDLRDLDLGRQPENVIAVGGGNRPRHVAGFAMPRRYLLDKPRPGQCSVTGRDGQVFDTYQRWPKGLSYAAVGWTMPFVAPVEKRDADGRTDKQWYATADAPLRLDDWLSPALGPEPAPEARFVAHTPPVVRALRNRLDDLIGALADAGPAAAESHVAEELPFSVRVVAQYTFGKAVGGLSEKTLPLYRLPPGEQRDLAQRTADAAARAAEIADILRKHASGVLKGATNASSPALPGQLHDTLLRRLEGQLMAALPAFAAAEEREAAQALREDLERSARTEALRLFDAAFPVTTIDDLAVRIASTRRLLMRDLFGQQTAAA